MKVSPNKKRTALKKRPQVKQVLPSQCLVCDNEQGYTATETTQEIEFRGELFQVAYKHMACGECGNAMLSDEQLVDRTKKVVEAYQQEHGLFTAAELIDARKARGYNSQRALLRAAPELPEATLKRIEAGMHAQDASTDALFHKVFTKLDKQEIMDLMNEPLEQVAEDSCLQFRKPQTFLEPLAAAACVTFAAGTMILASTTRIANREYSVEDSRYEIRIESC